MKKNFVKNLSFVLAAAMVVTAATLPVSAKAATKSGEVTARYLKEDKSTTAVTSKYIWAGGKRVNFDYQYGKKTSGVKGVWTSSNTDVVKVDPNTGVATAIKTGDVTLTFTPASSKYSQLTVAVKSRVRASYIKVRENSNDGSVFETVDGTDSTTVDQKVSVKPGTTSTFYVSMGTVTGAKSSYFVKAESNSSAAAVTNDVHSNYGRKVTVAVPATATGSAVLTFTADQYNDSRLGTGKHAVTRKVQLTVDTTDTTNNQYLNKLEVQQSGAKKIKVSGLTSIDGLTVNNNATTIEKAEVEKDGTGVTITLRSALTGGQVYTVEQNKKELGYFTAQSERLYTFEFKDDLQVPVGTTRATKATGTVELQNQFGERYPEATATVPVNGQAAKASTATPGLYTYTITNAKKGDYVKVTGSANKGRWYEQKTAYLTAKEGDENSYKINVKGIVKGTARNLQNLVSGDLDVDKDYWLAFTLQDNSGDYMTVEDGALNAWLTSTKDNKNTKLDLTNSSNFDKTLTADGKGYIYFVKLDTANTSSDELDKNITITFTSADGAAKTSVTNYVVAAKSGSSSSRVIADYNANPIQTIKFKVAGTDYIASANADASDKDVDGNEVTLSYTPALSTKNKTVAKIADGVVFNKAGNVYLEIEFEGKTYKTLGVTDADGYIKTTNPWYTTDDTENSVTLPTALSGKFKIGVAASSTKINNDASGTTITDPDSEIVKSSLYVVYDQGAVTSTEGAKATIYHLSDVSLK